jgi:NAD(P)-dependent dehydrogenase (short-subunit alcohol dehydrogenase family)
MRNDRRSSTSLDLEGRVILITGAARGLGRAYANLLARHGAHIGVHDAGVNLEGSIVDPMFAKKTNGELLAEGLTAAAFIILLNGASSCRRLIFHVVKRFGRLDALIHNAGIISWRDPAAVDPESFARSSRVNNEAAFFLTSAALQFMRERGFGRLVLTTSGWALQPASGSDELAIYAHGKGAQFGLAMALARGAGHPNIRTNVAPVAATRIFVAHHLPTHSVQKRWPEPSRGWHRRPAQLLAASFEPRVTCSRCPVSWTFSREIWGRRRTIP